MVMERFQGLSYANFMQRHDGDVICGHIALFHMDMQVSD